jgi:hypothetical protein
MPPSPTLPSLQAAVMDAILGGSFEQAVPWITDAALPALSVHRTNAQCSFADALRSSFPALFRLVGEDYFRQTAREFQRLHPSGSGDLTHAGAGFPDYLATLLDDGDYRCLADVARLEWLIQETLLAPDHARLDLEALARVAPEDYGAVRFVLHPALRLFESPFPALTIWEENIGGAGVGSGGGDEGRGGGVDGRGGGDAEPAPIRLDAGADRLAVMRRRGQLEFMRLREGELAFLKALAGGATFADAIASGETDAAFDASAALQRMVAADAIVDAIVGVSNGARQVAPDVVPR